MLVALKLISLFLTFAPFFAQSFLLFSSAPLLLSFPLSSTCNASN